MREILLEQQGKVVRLWIRCGSITGKVLGCGPEYARIDTPSGETAVRLEAIDAVVVLEEGGCGKEGRSVGRGR